MFVIRLDMQHQIYKATAVIIQCNLVTLRLHVGKLLDHVDQELLGLHIKQLKWFKAESILDS